MDYCACDPSVFEGSFQLFSISHSLQIDWLQKALDVTEKISNHYHENKIGSRLSSECITAL